MMTLVAMMLPLSHAYAQGGGGGGGAYGNAGQRCEQIKQQVSGADKDGAWVVEYVVMCVKTVMREAFEKFLNGFYPVVSSTITVAMTLCVTLFGVLLVTGIIEKSSRDSFVLLFKLGCILFFVKPSTVTQIYDMGNDSMDALTDIVFQFGKGSGGSGRCFDNDTVWDRIDCTLDVLIGTVKSGGAGAAGAVAGGGGQQALEGISRGLMHSNMMLIASTGMAAFVGLIVMYTTYQILMAIIKSVHTYLAAIMGLSFILVFAPMFIPMIMFKPTRSYFDKWQRIATSFVLQPVILFGFLSLMLIALEDILISGNGSYLKTVCGQQCDQRGVYPSKRCIESGACKTKATGATTRMDIGNSAERQLSTIKAGFKGGKAPVVAGGGKQQSQSADMGANYTWFDSYDMEKMGQMTGKGSEADQQKALALSAMALALAAFVFVSMLNYIPTLATDLSGGVNEVPNLFNKVGQHLPGGEQLQKFANEATGGITSKIDGYTKQLQSMITGRR